MERDELGLGVGMSFNELGVSKPSVGRKAIGSLHGRGRLSQ